MTSRPTKAIYELVHIDTCEVVERFSDRDKALRECEGMNNLYRSPLFPNGKAVYCVCTEGGLPI